MVYSTATARACQLWRSRLTFPRPRSARAISRKPIPSSFFGNAPAIANLFRPSNRCPARSKSPYVVRSMSGVSASSSSRATWRSSRRRTYPRRCRWASCRRSRLSCPPYQTLDKLADLLNGARRVTLLCGSGCEGAHDELMQLAEALKAPIVHALRGKEHVESENPYDVGMTGLIGFASGYHAMAACDPLLMLGTDFPYRQFFPKDARIAQIDIRAEAIGRRAPVELGLVGQVGATLQLLLPRLVSKRDRSHLDAALKNYAEARKGLDDLASGRSGGPLHPQLIAPLASELASADAIVTCDVGLPTVWAARYLAMNGRRRLVGSFLHGLMGDALG